MMSHEARFGFTKPSYPHERVFTEASGLVHMWLGKCGNEHTARLLRDSSMDPVPDVLEAQCHGCDQPMIFQRVMMDVTCEWFAMCTERATHLEPHPVLGHVPQCGRCARIGVRSWFRTANGLERE